MAQDTYQLDGSAAAVYEEQKVNAIFAPLARASLDAIALQPGDRVLDVACGTGIVARIVRERFGTKVSVSGSDVNPDMVGLAQMLTETLDPPIEWHVADITALPFKDGLFNVCICQQGFQFFPDKSAAASELHRVLSPGGRVVISVWDGASAFFIAMAKALRRHVGDDIAQQSLAPFAFSGTETLPQLLTDAGFVNISVQSISIDRVLASPETAIPREIFGNPVGAEVRNKGDEVIGLITQDIVTDCAKYMIDDSLVVPQKAHLITASVRH